MSKKVLISLNELFALMVNAYEHPREKYPARKELYDSAKKWFDAQPGVEDEKSTD